MFLKALAIVISILAAAYFYTWANEGVAVYFFLSGVAKLFKEIVLTLGLYYY